MVFGAIAKIDRTSITPFMEYVGRMAPEWQAVFAVNLSKNPDKKQIGFTSAKFRDWALKNVEHPVTEELQRRGCESGLKGMRLWQVTLFRWQSRWARFSIWSPRRVVAAFTVRDLTD